MLVLLRDKARLLEADLDRFYHRDLRDLWRFDEQGQRRLTLRMVYVRVLELPATSALAKDANGGKAPWSLTDHLVADLWALTARKSLGKKAPRDLDHPGRPKGSPKPMTPERAAQMQKAKRRRAAIQQRRQRRKEE